MPREIPDAPNDWKPRRPDPGRSYDIKLLTPMFGGGVSTRANDPTFPIRPTAIRGQLQFWWRATVGAQYATRQELRAAQSAVWGDTAQASRVQVRLAEVQATTPEPCARYVPDNNRPGSFRTVPIWNAPFHGTALPYALFPFQGQLAKGRKQVEVEPACCIHKASFKLTVISHNDIDFAKQVEPALWAWANFGGLGGRTRRGCGAVHCETFAPENVNDLRAMWQRYMPERFPRREWSTLGEGARLNSDEQPGSPIGAWDHVIELYRNFRQGVRLGRNPGQTDPKRPGRSRYPEPETIRQVTGRRMAIHARLPRIPDDAFPRAELGLPIVFHFQGEQAGDPQDTVLYPDNDFEGKKRERMASPLILRPLALRSGKTMPLVLTLQTPSLSGVDLRRGETSLGLPASTAIRDPRLSSYPNSPLTKSPIGSATEAFLAVASDAGFTEVIR